MNDGKHEHKQIEDDNNLFRGSTFEAVEFEIVYHRMIISSFELVNNIKQLI